MIKIVRTLLQLSNSFPPVFHSSQFAGTLSDGLGKTMDSRHQSEREYIRYHAATSGEHLVAGIHGLAHGKSVTRCQVRSSGSSATAPQRCPFSHPICKQKQKADSSGDPGLVSGCACQPSELAAVFIPLAIEMVQPGRSLPSFSQGCAVAIPSCSLASVPKVSSGVIS